MNYEEKYNQALKRASKLRVQNPFDTISQMMEHVFPELRESEDERIKKAIICGMNALKEQHKETFASIPINDCIAWLEKQGEQKPINQCNMNEPTLDEARKWNEAYEKGYSLGYKNGRNEQKPAWSEEDEKMLTSTIEYLNEFKEVYQKGAQECIKWLKSIKPNHWKPSEEQMEALHSSLHYLPASIFYKVECLYNDLEKL